MTLLFIKGHCSITFGMLSSTMARVDRFKLPTVPNAFFAQRGRVCFCQSKCFCNVCLHPYWDYRKQSLLSREDDPPR